MSGCIACMFPMAKFVEKIGYCWRPIVLFCLPAVHDVTRPQSKPLCRMQSCEWLLGLARWGTEQRWEKVMRGPGWEASDLDRFKHSWDVWDDICWFPKVGIPLNLRLNRMFHYQPSISDHFWVPAFMETPICVCDGFKPPTRFQE